MQITYDFIPMVQAFLCKNMPHGGYSIITSRLKKSFNDIKVREVKYEIMFIKPKGSINHLILQEACKFLKESNVPLDEYCENYLELENKKES